LKVWLKRIAVIILTVVLLLFVGIFFSLKSSPHIRPLHHMDANSAAENKNIAQRLVKSLKSKKSPILLSVSQKELDGLSALVHRAFPRLISNVFLLENVALIYASLELPLPESIRYLNIEVTLLASEHGLDLDTVYIGAVPLSGNWLVKCVEWLTNTFIKEEFGTSLINMVKRVAIEKQHIDVSIELLADMFKQTQDSKSGLIALRDQLAFYGEVEVIKFYHQTLVDLSSRTPANTSFSYYIGYMFGLAKQRSVVELGASAIEENQAALMALVIHFGSNKFELLVGDIANLSPEQSMQRIKQQSRSTLRQRVDIQKHYVYSIALQLFGNSQTSDAIGELKELLDSNKGGSGFSFADLMADRAGTRLAMLATQSESAARQVQNILTDTQSESQILPKLIGLPESISQQDFESNYRNINSTTYKAMLAVIDERLQQLAVYRIRD